MSPALASLLALVVALVLSMTTRINVGLVALVLAWVVGAYDSGTLGLDVVTNAFPSSLFLTALGVMAFFAAAESNGTLDRLARHAGRQLAFSDARLFAPIVFLLACAVAAIGPGTVPSVALVAPIAMAVGPRAGLTPFVIALLVGNGANAGNLSPVSAAGIVVNTKMAAVGLGGHEVKVMMANFLASILVTVVGFALFGRRRPAAVADTPENAPDGEPCWTWRHRLTLGAIATWIVCVVWLKWNLGLSALAALVLMIAARAVDEVATIRRVPWGALLMVTGVTTLVELLNATGGMDLFTSLLSRCATAHTVNAVMAFVTGAISLYSSTYAVVLPTFLPTVPSLIEKIGGGDPLAVALSVNVGASLVDVSPLSTMGALCLAAAPASIEARPLFRKLLLWGFAMLFVGAIICQLFAGMLARL
jgi:Na+/H+ antiporter NhaD/arsenite permease-like protein